MKGVEADAPVFIVLGVLIVIVGLTIVYGIVGNIGGTSTQGQQQEVTELVNVIEQKCSDFQEYDTLLTDTVNFEVYESNLALSQSSAEFGDTTLSIECSSDINYQYNGDNSEIELEPGSYEAAIGSNNSEIEVEVE